VVERRGAMTAHGTDSHSNGARKTKN